VLLGNLISRSRKRYAYTLKAIAGGVNTWAEIKAYVMSKSGKISDTVLSSLLQHLVKLGIIEKGQKDVYSIADPLVVFAIKKLKP
jgi:DNA-binding HxlR family transcriptional regulator